MKKILTISLLSLLALPSMANNEIGPEGHKLILILIVIIVAIFFAVLLLKSIGKTSGIKEIFVRQKKIAVSLKKDRLYYPDILELDITNIGKGDVDIAKPLLIFSSLWFKRKFILKGTSSYQFYPLFLGQGQSHKLNIDLNRFYMHDKSLKRLPHVKVVIYEEKGKRLGSRKVLLRKTLFNF